jgi:hypothetical protein
MVNSTATAGNLIKGGIRFLHNFGQNNTFLGGNAGNLTMVGIGANTATGVDALSSNTTGANNTAGGTGALSSNTEGNYNTASGTSALGRNTTGAHNTASGHLALFHNTTGSQNTAIGSNAGFSPAGPNLTNTTAIGYAAVVNASNNIRLGNASVTVIEGQVGFTASSDRNLKENFLPVDGEEVLGKIGELSLTSWNFIGHDPKQFRHYGPMAQDFFAAFGHDGIGTIGTETTITSTDMAGVLMISAQALQKRSVEQEKRTLEQTKKIDALTAENSELKMRLEALERRIGATH